MITILSTVHVLEIDLQGIGAAFGFTVPPRVDLNFSTRGDKKSSGRVSKRPREEESNHDARKNGKYGSSGHAFSADNPYGKRQASDKRQFSR